MIEYSRTIVQFLEQDLCPAQWIRWLYSYSLLALILGCKYSPPLYTVPLCLGDCSFVSSKHSLTAGLSQWFRKGIFYQNKKPSGIAGTDQKSWASWQIAFMQDWPLGLLKGESSTYKLWKPMLSHKTVILNRKNVSLSWKAYNYEWMNDPDPYKFFP